MNAERGARAVIVTGAPGSGKSSAVLAAAALSAARGLRLRACLSEATERIPEGLALGFRLALYESTGDAPESTTVGGAEAPADGVGGVGALAAAPPGAAAGRAGATPVSANSLAEKARYPLASRPPPLPGPGPIRERMRPFVFRYESFAPAIAFLAAGLGSLDIVAVDEIGPLELSDGGGFMPLLEAWKADGGPVLLATARPALARELADRLEDGGRSPERKAAGERGTGGGAASAEIVRIDGLGAAEAARRVADALAAALSAKDF